MPFATRSPLKIEYAILEVCKEPRLISHISSKVGLMHGSAKFYIEKLCGNGLLAVSHNDEGRVVYSTTEKGLEFIFHRVILCVV